MPLRVNSQNEMEYPDRSAMPIITMLALEPTAVRLPPKSPPSASDHHNTLWCSWCGMDEPRWVTIGVIVATYGTLSIRPDASIDTHRISMVVNKALPPVAPAANS